jgi:hypothetical protein
LPCGSVFCSEIGMLRLQAFNPLLLRISCADSMRRQQLIVPRFLSTTALFYMNHQIDRTLWHMQW